MSKPFFCGIERRRVPGHGARHLFDLPLDTSLVAMHDGARPQMNPQRPPRPA